MAKNSEPGRPWNAAATGVSSENPARQPVPPQTMTASSHPPDDGRVAPRRSSTRKPAKAAYAGRKSHSAGAVNATESGALPALTTTPPAAHSSRPAVSDPRAARRPGSARAARATCEQAGEQHGQAGQQE